MISVERLYKSFDVPALRGVALTVPDGTILGIVGPPASGKSLTLRAIAGLIEPDAGSIRIQGDEMVGSRYAERARLQERLGMAFQNIALFEHLTVGENVAFPLRRRGLQDPSEIRSRVEEALATVGLGGFEERAVQGLSGGQKRRVGLARAAIHRPAYLLYDEPAAGLDPVTSARTFALLRRQQEKTGATIAVVSSDVASVLGSVDRVAVFRAGRVVFEGPASEARRARQDFVREFLGGAFSPSERISVASLGELLSSSGTLERPEAPQQGEQLLAHVLGQAKPQVPTWGSSPPGPASVPPARSPELPRSPEPSAPPPSSTPARRSWAEAPPPPSSSEPSPLDPWRKK